MNDVPGLGDRATVGAWLASRKPPPPSLLRSRRTEAVGEALSREIGETERVCLEAAERVLERLVDDNAATRQAAVDLLAADALVTYALERAAEHPEDFEEHASGAIERFGRMSEPRE